MPASPPGSCSTLIRRDVSPSAFAVAATMYVPDKALRFRTSKPSSPTGAEFSTIDQHGSVEIQADRQTHLLRRSRGFGQIDPNFTPRGPLPKGVPRSDQHPG